MRLAGLMSSALALTLTASTGLAQMPALPNFSLIEAEQIAGQKLFSDHCAACHVRKAGAHGVLGPSLRGVVGRPAGSAPGFPYSEAMKRSGVVWTEDNLRKWVADNAKMIPNTLMPHVSISDPAEQIYLVAYLKTLKKG